MMFLLFSYRVNQAAGVITPDRLPPNPVDDQGFFTSEVSDYVGQYVKDAGQSETACLAPSTHFDRQKHRQGTQGEGSCCC
jgi:isoleucyl-tRNA synthetase